MISFGSGFGQRYALSVLAVAVASFCHDDGWRTEGIILRDVYLRCCLWVIPTIEDSVERRGNHNHCFVLSVLISLIAALCSNMPDTWKVR